MRYNTYIMPELSRFYGIIIKMFFIGSKHNPPHIHVIYGEYTGMINIVTGELIEGDLPVRALKMVREWLDIHRDEIQTIWDSQEFRKVAPLA